MAVLDCHANNLSTLDVSKNSLLETFNAAENNLVQVTLGMQATLSDLNLSDNKIETLDVTQLPLLETVRVENNSLKTFDLSQNADVKWIYVYGNQINGEQMDDFMSNLPIAVQSPSLLYVVNTFNSEGEGNVCLMKDVQTARAKGWVTMDYANGVENSGMIGQFYYGDDYVPEISDNGVKFTTSRSSGETIKLYIKSAADFTVEGVAESNFVSGSNTLTLTSSEVIVKGDLTVFECQGNDITSLEFVGSCSMLTSFDCSDNKIKQLVINNAPALTQIHAQKNALKNLDIKGCTGIMRVDCYDNDLHGKAMKTFMESLPDGTQNEPYLFVIDTKSETEKNIATTTDVAIATGKNWVVFDYLGGDNWGMGSRYEGSEPQDPELPNEYFTFSTEGVTDILLNIEYIDPEYYPVVEGAEILGWGSGALTLRVTPGETVKVYGDAKMVSSNLAFISSFNAGDCTNLIELHLMANELTSLDLSRNAKLQNLLIWGNSLDNLDLSGCTDLQFVVCYGNKLSGDAMTSFM